MNKYEMKTNITLLTRKRDALIKKLADIGPFVDGSFVKIKRRCGNKNCKCALLDEKHESYCLMYKLKGVTKAVYVPVDLEEQVRSWNKEHQKLKRILSEVSKINKEIIRRYVGEKQLKKVRE